MIQSLFHLAPDFLKGHFAFLGPTRILVVLLLAFSVFAWFAYRAFAARIPAWRILLVIRIVLFAILLAILAIPVIRMAGNQGERFTVVLLDTSRSMATVDAGSGPVSRLDAARELLVGNGKLLTQLEKSGKVLLYQFDETVRRANFKAELKPDGEFTNIYRGIHDMEAELRGVPLTSVILMTDGARNSGGSTQDAAALLKARGVPLFVIGLGNPIPPTDFEIVRVVAPRRVRRNSEVEVQVTIRHTGFPDPFEVILNRGEAAIASRTVTPQAGSDLEQIKLHFTPDHEGSSTYTVSIAPGPGELNAENNKRDFLLEIQDDRLPVLYVEGSPRLEYRFLRRALYSDHDFRVVGCLRLGDNRYYVQGANESEAFLNQGFPTTVDQLYAFQAVIIGDTEAKYFTPKQLEMLEEFVRTRGGGLMMLGGVNSFGLGNYEGTPIANLLPTAITSHDGPYTDERFKVRVLQSIGLHPVMRLSLDPEANRTLWAQAPPLIGLTPVAGVKTGALTLLTRESDNKPVLAVHNYGQGRVAAFTSGGSWYWRMSLPADVEFHEKFWKQLVRWLAVGAKERLSVETDSDIVSRGKTISIRATALAKDLQPVNDASLVASITDPLGNREEIPLDWILSEDGVYAGQYVPKEEGDYRVAVTAEGWDLKPVETDFRVSAPAAESADAGLKETTLRDMAATAQGKYFSYEEAGSLPAEVEKSAERVKFVEAGSEDKPVWDSPAIFLLVLGLMVAEWIVRRKVGLA